VRLNLGMARFMAGDRNAAAREFRAAVTIDPKFAEAWLSLSTTLAETGRPKEAAEAADKAAALANTPELLEAARSTRASVPGPRGPRTK
jgi:Tfp pilus assembly protein PilF